MSALRIGLSLLCILFAAGMLPACELDNDDNDGGYDGYNPPDGDDGGGGDVSQEKYFFVLVRDQTPYCDDLSPGADIDAVVLTEENGTRHGAAYAVEHDIKTPAGKTNEHDDPAACYGEPDCDTNPDNCYVSLGGPGGYLFVNYNGEEITTGDSITVTIYDPSTGTGTTVEQVELEVQVAGTDREFRPIGVCVGPGECSFTID